MDIIINIYYYDIKITHVLNVILKSDECELVETLNIIKQKFMINVNGKILYDLLTWFL